MMKSIPRCVYNKVVNWLSNAPQPIGYPITDFGRLRQEIRPGDVLLVEGTSRIAETIKIVTQSRWSHAALYIGRLHDVEDPLIRQSIKLHFDGQPNIQLIVESELGLGTLIRPLDTYDQKHLRICRPRELSYEDTQHVIAYAVKRLGSEYDVRQIFDLLRFYLPWGILPRKLQSSIFRWKPGASTKTICSTMLAEAFSSVNYPILPLIKRGENNQLAYFQRNPMLTTPSDFDYSPYFDIIKYPFYEALKTEHLSYSDLPWHQNLDLDEAESKFYMSPESQLHLLKEKTRRKRKPGSEEA